MTFNEEETIVKTIENIFSAVKYDYKIISEIYKIIKLKKTVNLDHIILSIGPGSYSGLRAGSSFAKGLAYAVGKNIIPLNTINVMNSLVNHDGEY